MSALSKKEKLQLLRKQLEELNNSDSDLESDSDSDLELKNTSTDTSTNTEEGQTYSTTEQKFNLEIKKSNKIVENINLEIESLRLELEIEKKEINNLQLESYDTYKQLVDNNIKYEQLVTEHANSKYETICFINGKLNSYNVNLKKTLNLKYIDYIPAGHNVIIDNANYNELISLLSPTNGESHYDSNSQYINGIIPNGIIPNKDRYNKRYEVSSYTELKSKYSYVLDYKNQLDKLNPLLKLNYEKYKDELETETNNLLVSLSSLGISIANIEKRILQLESKLKEKTELRNTQVVILNKRIVELDQYKRNAKKNISKPAVLRLSSRLDK
jgi:hypothetical protein